MEAKALLASMLEVAHANQKKRDEFSHLICQQFVMTTNVVIFFRKEFYLIEAINDKINSFLASGIMEHWIEKSVDMHFATRKVIKRGPKKLNIEHLSGIFKLLCIGCAVSSMFFVFELLYFKLRTKQTKITFI